MIVERTEGAAQHPVEIKRTVQMVDLMLQDARIPSRGLDDLQRAAMVKTFDAHAVGPRDDRRISRQTEASLKELDIRRTLQLEHGINEDVKRDRLPLAFGDLLS